MNVLPLVFILLSVFALMASSSRTTLQSSALIKKEYLGYLHADRLARKKAYDHQMGKKQSSKKESSKPKDVKKKSNLQIISKRDWKKLETRQGMNLFPLLNLDAEKREKAKLGVLAWTDYLYRKCDLYDREELSVFIDTLLQLAKDKTEIKTLGEILSLEIPVSENLYLLFQGTSLFDIETGSGIPPLGTFLCFNPEVRGVLQWKYTCIPLVKVLLGKDVAEKILDIEKLNAEKTHRHKSALFSDFKDSFSHDATLHNTLLFWEELSSEAMRQRSLYQAQDDSTGIRVQIESIQF